MSNKNAVKEFWNASSCGEDLYLQGSTEKDAYNNQSSMRYYLEPYIPEFANFKNTIGKDILEIGVGLGSDHQKFAENGAILTGIDLTDRAIQYTKKRFQIYNLNSNLLVDDAENLSFNNDSFDMVYSWGVIHHSPDTSKAISEIFRVLRKDGEARIMIYSKYSIVGYMLWIRYALFKLKPFTTLTEIYSNYLESPGTKAYSVREAKKLFKEFKDVKINTILTHSDLLESKAGQRHQGIILNLARLIFPRKFIKLILPNSGLFMLIIAKK